MAKELRLQDPGEGIHEAEIQEILVGEGDTVEEGDALLVVETDKSAVEVPSPHSGRIKEILVAAHDHVRVGDVLVRFDDTPDGKTKAAPEPAEQQADDDTADDDAGRDAARARDGSEDAGADRDDREEPADDERPQAEPAITSDARKRRAVPATPATRRLARELGIDLGDVEPSGADGRVTKDDVRAHAGDDRGRDKPDRGVPGRRQELGAVRRATARHMAEAWATIPHVTHHERVDITALERFRGRHAAAVEADGGKLSLTPFALKAAAVALREHPTFNARFDAEGPALELRDELHIGVALDSARGLIVPVIRDVDRKSVAALAIELVELAERLRDAAPAPEDLEGGSFTITNVGGIGGSGFTPIVNHPQVAILGLAQARLEQIVDGTLERPRPRVGMILPLCVAFDHRANDGADAARFAGRIAELLASPDRLALYG